MSQIIRLRAEVKRILGDTLTPLSMYLRIRDRYPRSVLLESADYQPNESCFTYLCVNPIAEFRVQDGRIHKCFPDGEAETQVFNAPSRVLEELKNFASSFQLEIEDRYRFIGNGLFGYISYDAVQYFEDIRFKRDEDLRRRIPDVYYHAFQFVIAINHYKHETFILENKCLSHCAAMPRTTLAELEYLIGHADVPSYGFKTVGDEASNFTHKEHLEMIAKCKEHIYRGDIFQIVPSRRFEQGFRGDEFQVYRALRSINPSPFLFFFDYGAFKLFGSSPEAELIVEGRKASIYPIAGTCRRSGSEAEDACLVEALKADPKENSEHVMLVDLARNDLSKHCDHVYVERFKEVHKYSHVIHLVSKVSGSMFERTGTLQLLADTFPAGTLSGAPKYRAMELLDAYEHGRRGFYGGAIGLIGFNGDLVHAIMIRSFLSQGNMLFSQAGGGVVADSVPENEVQEIVNKLGALKSALAMAEEI